MVNCSSYRGVLQLLIVLLIVKEFGSSSVPVHSGDDSTTKPCATKSFVLTWDKEDYPNPQTNIKGDFCGRGCKSSWICDPGHIISTEQADALDKEIDSIRKTTSCMCMSCEDEEGYIISIALVPSITYIPGMENAAAKNFTDYLRNVSWSYGDCGNDVVIFVSKELKMVQMSAGKMVNEMFGKECLLKIQTEAQVLIKQDKIVPGLHHLVSRFSHIFKSKSCDIPTQDSQINTALIVILITVGILFLICIFSVVLHRQGHCQRLNTYRINLPPITIRIRKPRKHHHHHHDHDHHGHHHEERRNSTSSHSGEELQPMYTVDDIKEGLSQ
ncbi:Hypothetical predicted protein [Mytilus galloprovincialis]|uniref:TPM domain-containing protein n=1 Tax=Mytilus galloprovincialis TaxID=29158 RepID=A0A8B6EQP3_MYTGA|nr:Hypothetical predicted protein [Mytilus galloprovincialis]